MNIQDIASASAMIKQELEPLAQKIGEGAEHVYGLFIKQVYVNAFIELLWIIPGTIGLFFSFKLFKWLERETAKDDADADGITAVVIFWLILLLVSIAMVIIPLFGLIQALVNPEFAAIKLIIDTVKGH